MFRFGITFIAAFALALLLQGEVAVAALLAAGVLGIVAAGWAVVLGRVGPRRRFVFSAACLLPTLRTIGRLPWVTLRIGAMLLRAAFMGGSPGKASESVFLFGEDDDPADRARCAVAVTLGCMTPDTIIVDIDPHGSTALAHRLLPGQPAPDRTWLT